MGKLITITGVSGTGKTTFTQKLGEITGMSVFLEQHAPRPFHDKAVSDPDSFMLQNQLDFLIYRVEQELEIRKSVNTGIVDGGLETDYHVFTRLFHQRGLLFDAAFDLCTRFYHLVRSLTPPPDLIIYLKAPIEVISERFLRRQRLVEVSRLEDLAAQQVLIESWLAADKNSRIIIIDAEEDDPLYVQGINKLLPLIGNYN
jgi:deoxyadenosine/deoxycytidine kinase